MKAARSLAASQAGSAVERLAAPRVRKAAQAYGSERAKKFFTRALAEVGAEHAA